MPSINSLSRATLTLLLVLILAACRSADPNEAYIQGTWMAAGDQGEGHSWYIEWTFNNGEFHVEGYPPLVQNGNYTVIASEDSTLTLQLTNQEGDWPTDDLEIVVVIDSANNTLTIDNLGPFTKSIS